MSQYGIIVENLSKRSSFKTDLFLVCLKSLQVWFRDTHVVFLILISICTQVKPFLVKTTKESEYYSLQFQTLHKINTTNCYFSKLKLKDSHLVKIEILFLLQKYLKKYDKELKKCLIKVLKFKSL